jgi:hypothetical protein
MICFETSTFEVFNSQNLFSLWWLSPGVEDLLTPVPCKWVVQMNSDSLAFGSSCSIPSLSSRVISPGVVDHLPHVLSKSTTLVLFGTSTLFNQDQINGLQLPFRSTVEILLRHFDASTLYFPSKYFVPRVLDLALLGNSIA